MFGAITATFRAARGARGQNRRPCAAADPNARRWPRVSQSASCPLWRLWWGGAPAGRLSRRTEPVPRPPPVPNFHPRLSIGRWYEYVRYYVASANGLRCGQVDIFDTGSVRYRGVLATGGKTSELTEVAESASRPSKGKFRFVGAVTPNVGSGDRRGKASFVVIDCIPNWSLANWPACHTDQFSSSGNIIIFSTPGWTNCIQ